MKALSIRNPWAWLIANGFKGVENRSWYTNFRGEFYIHAGKVMTNDDYKDCIDFIKYDIGHYFFPELPSLMSEYGMWHKKDFQQYNGMIIGKAKMVGCVSPKDKHLLSEKDQRWYMGQYAFIIDSAEPIEPFPYKGQLGWFDVTEEGIEEAKERQGVLV